MTRKAEEQLISEGLKEGDIVVITGGVPVGAAGHTNLIKVQVLGEK
jgi:pyruvate kinase